MSTTKNTSLIVIIFIVFLTLLSGCGQQEDGKPWAVKEICIKGVAYYRTGYSLAPAYNHDGLLIMCEKESNTKPNTSS